MKKILFTALTLAAILFLAGCPTPNNPILNNAIPNNPADGDTASNDTPEKYNITIESSGAENSEKVTADVTEAPEGTSVTLTATLDSNSRKVSFSTTEDVISPYTIFTTSGTRSFVMPAKDFTITATFSDRAASATPKSCTANGLTFNMMYVHSGTFTMGQDVYTPSLSVTLTKDFWMADTELTQRLWERVWGEWPGDVPVNATGDGDYYPAYNVNWYEAVAFCNLITQADNSIENTEQVYYSDEAKTIAYTKTDSENQATVYADWSKTGYRLPTEAEWEYAARYIDADNNNWNGGDHVSGGPQYQDANVGNYGWYSGNSNLTSHRTREKSWNNLRLYDMSGNVAEWCYDLNTALYSTNPQIDPIGGKTGDRRVIRGGSWSFDAEYMQTAHRYSGKATDRYSTFGFRLCRTAE